MLWLFFSEGMQVLCVKNEQKLDLTKQARKIYFCPYISVLLTAGLKLLVRQNWISQQSTVQQAIRAAGRVCSQRKIHLQTLHLAQNPELSLPPFPYPLFFSSTPCTVIRLSIPYISSHVLCAEIFFSKNEFLCSDLMLYAFLTLATLFMSSLSVL